MPSRALTVRSALDFERAGEKSRGFRRVTYLGVAAAVGLLVVFPLLGIAWQSLRDAQGNLSVAGFFSIFGEKRFQEALRNTLVLACGTAAGALLMAVPLAFGVARTAMRFKRLVRLSVLIAFASPPFLMTLSYVLLAGPNNGLANQWIRALLGLDLSVGPLNIFSRWGFVVLALPNAVALIFVILLPAFRNMDASLEEAARLAGVSGPQAVFRVSLPMMRPAMLAGALLAFSTAFAMFATPHMLGIEVLTVEMRRSVLSAGSFSRASSIALISGIVSSSVMILYRGSLSRAERFVVVGARGTRVRPINVGWLTPLLSILALVYSVFGAIAPYALLVVLSFLKAPYRGLAAGNFTLDHYSFVLGHPTVQTAIRNSVFLAVTAATIIAILGIGVAYVVTRTKARGRALLDYVAVMPLGIAGTAFAVGVIVLHLFTPMKELGLYGSLWIMLMAYVGRYLPWGVRTAQVSMMQISTEMEEAGRVAGLGEGRALLQITLPLIRAGIAYAWILGLVQALTEVSASVILAGPRSGVIATSLLWLWSGADGLQRASVLGVLMFFVTMLLVWVAQKVGKTSLIERAT